MALLASLMAQDRPAQGRGCERGLALQWIRAYVAHVCSHVRPSPEQDMQEHGCNMPGGSGQESGHMQSCRAADPCADWTPMKVDVWREMTEDSH